MNRTRWLIIYLIVVLGALGAAAYIFAPGERCAVVPALQIGSKGPRC